MNSLQQQHAALRAARRRLAARRAGGAPTRVEPARLVLRLDDGDRPERMADRPALSPARWHGLIVQAVDWLGPVEVTVWAPRTSGGFLAAELVRFAHRLDCRTVLLTDGAGVDLDKARELWDRGLQLARVRVGGVSAEAHRAVVGGELDDAVGAVRALVRARDERGAPGQIEVVQPWRGPAASELRAVVGWARQAGADGFRVEAPWRSVGMPADPEALDALEELAAGFDRTPPALIQELHAMAASSDGGPGMPRAQAPARRRRWRCTVGGERLELHAQGGLCCCPFKDLITLDLAGTDLTVAWATAGPHLDAIAHCTRACPHSELAPRPLLTLP